MIRHTPGPWIVGPLFEIRAPQTGKVVCIVAQALMGSTITFEERASNAHLIAAAPDLLTALRAIDATHAAIARAEGRP
jgi:hypothetical protein